MAGFVPEAGKGYNRKVSVRFKTRVRPCVVAGNGAGLQKEKMPDERQLAAGRNPFRVAIGLGTASQGSLASSATWALSQNPVGGILAASRAGLENENRQAEPAWRLVK